VSDTVLTLHEAALLLGVHYMTAYRYVRLGLLDAEKVSGTWQVKMSDLDAFRAGLGPTPVDPESRRRRAPWAERLEARLIAGDAKGAWGVVEAALAGGTELDQVYLDILAPAMQSIGARWAAGELDISVEHRATGIAFRIIGQLGPRFSRRGRTRGTVLVGAPAGERHSLPLAIVADLLRGEGWEVSDLGADMPADSFIHAALEFSDLAAVGVSVTNPDCLEAASELCHALKAAVGEEVYVAVGGAAVRDVQHARELGADGWASSAREFARQLSGGSEADTA